MFKNFVLGLTGFVLCGVSVAHSRDAAATLEDEVRLESIGYRLSVANASLCDKHAMLSGLDLVNMADYDEGKRSALGDLGLVGGSFLVVHVQEQSGAANAGLIAGDIIEAVGGKPMDSFYPELVMGRADYRRSALFSDFLSDSLRKGHNQISILRKGARLSIELAAQQGCDYQFVLEPGERTNAWSDGKSVAITTRLLQVARNDSELAFAVAHEMAHNILGHANKFESGASLAEKLGIGAKARREAEFDADALAVTLMMAGGYEVSASLDYMDLLAKLNPLYIPTTHPSFAARKNELEKTLNRSR